VIGHSRQGRAIKAVHTGNPAGPRVLIVGCIHGNECAARALITPLVAARLDADLWIIPTLNPDGMRRGTRQNAAGVDLNRNWKRWWVRSGRPWSTFYSGPSAFSEPETRVGRVFIGKIRPQVTIWYHQHMNLVWASGTSTATGQVYARAVGMGLRTDDTIRGTASGWQRRVFADAPAFVVELPAGAMSAGARGAHVRAIRAVSAAVR
jgi:protein MpaA